MPKKQTWDEEELAMLAESELDAPTLCSINGCLAVKFPGRMKQASNIEKVFL